MRLNLRKTAQEHGDLRYILYLDMGRVRTQLVEEFLRDAYDVQNEAFSIMHGNTIVPPTTRIESDLLMVRGYFEDRTRWVDAYAKIWNLVQFIDGIWMERTVQEYNADEGTWISLLNHPDSWYWASEMANWRKPTPETTRAQYYPDLDLEMLDET